MNTLEKSQLIRRARAAWQQYKTARAQAASDRVKAEAAAPGLNAEDLADATDNTLKKDILESGQGLEVLIPEYLNLPISGVVDNIILQWSRDGSTDFLDIGTAPVTGPVAPGTFPLSMTVDDRYLHPDGRCSVRYTIVHWNEEESPSLPTTLICDGTPPWGRNEPAAAVPPGDPITDAYLAQYTDVVCTLPDYDWQDGDQVEFWWLNEPPRDPDALPPDGAGAVSASPHQITVPADIVRAVGDGGCYVLYRLIDKAGNRSRLSRYVRVSVALGPLPQDLAPPQVPQADVKGYVDLYDAFQGIVVAIPQFTNWKSTDRIEVTWGGTVLMPLPIDHGPQDPVLIGVPPGVLEQEYGQAEGRVATDVSYRVLRGDEAFGPESTRVDVDFSVPGPALPEWPDPVNPDLPPLQVMGEVSQTLNTLTRVDAEKDAIVTFKLYEPLKEGEVIQFYWAGTHVEEIDYTVSVPPDEAEQDREVKIPWSYIRAAGNDPVLPVYYRITSPDAVNEQQSPTTPVDADAVTIVPEAPLCLNTTPANGYLTCASLVHEGAEPVVLVQIPDLSPYLADEDKVTLHWLPVDRMEDGEVIEEHVKTDEVVLGGEYPVTGFIWRVEYLEHILPIYDNTPGGTGPAGRARVYYTLNYKGEELTSAEDNRVAAFFNANDPCPLP